MDSDRGSPDLDEALHEFEMACIAAVRWRRNFAGPNRIRIDAAFQQVKTAYKRVCAIDDARQLSP